jgi:aspartyl-tRNA(Asn)/glutamyl-tRNA(Gln) amidotransferase subunit A
VGGHEELCWLSAVEMRALLRARTLSPVELVEAHLARIELANPAINAYVTLCAERALEEARAAQGAILGGSDNLPPLLGIPVSIKDLVFTEGVRTTSGSRIFADRVPDQDAHSVARLRQAGAIVLGKTNTPEFGFKAVTDNPLFGATRNPWDLSRTSGGSSGGAAAAAAAGLAPLNLGTDGGGSIRIPASLCGIFGLKPAYGRVSNSPTPIGWTSLGHPGPMTRTVRDAALMLQCMAGPSELDRISLPATDDDWVRAVETAPSGLKVGFTLDWGGKQPLDPEVRRLVSDAVRVFVSDLGCEVVDEAPDLEAATAIFNAVVSGYTAGELSPYLPHWRDQMDPALVRYIERTNATLTLADFIQADQARNLLAREVGAFFEKFDLLLTPTLAVPAFDLEAGFPRNIDGVSADPLTWLMTYPFNLTGHPAASIPCGFTSEGLPVGLQVVGRRFAEATVLQACAAYEAAHPWEHRRPPL